MVKFWLYNIKARLFDSIAQFFPFQHLLRLRLCKPGLLKLRVAKWNFGVPKQIALTNQR